MTNLLPSVIITPGHKKHRLFAAMAQLVERVLGKDEVTGSIPVSSSKNPDCLRSRDFYFLPSTSSLLPQPKFLTVFLEVRGNK